MVLHRPVECTREIGNLGTGTMGKPALACSYTLDLVVVDCGEGISRGEGSGDGGVGRRRDHGVYR
jgi:hypothetical protein